MGTIVLVALVVSSIPRIPLATVMTRAANRFRGCLTLLFLGSAALFGLLASRSTRAFVGTSQPAGRRTCKTGLRAIGLFFATQTGNTETVAGMIGEATGAEATDIGEIETEDLAGYDGLIVGCPTWNTGADEMRSGTAWDDVLEDIKGLDLAGKPVAVFGCGDSASYGDNFCDGIEELHETSRLQAPRWSVTWIVPVTATLSRRARRTVSFWVCQLTRTTKMTSPRSALPIGSRN